MLGQSVLVESRMIYQQRGQVLRGRQTPWDLRVKFLLHQFVRVFQSVCCEPPFYLRPLPSSFGCVNVRMIACDLCNLFCCWRVVQERDPVLELSDDYVMAGRVAAILRGLGYAVKHKPSAAKLWAPQARELVNSHADTVYE